MFRSKISKVFVTIPRKILEDIYDECDRFDSDETGGRIIGTYQEDGKGYKISVSGLIGAGPNARRSPTTFFQDGDYQEQVFREIEHRQPEVEHLGNWHTHHVNGLRTLSSGDRATYRRVVNHDRHNTDFFYALLVVDKGKPAHERYETKHYFLFRGDDDIHEIPISNVEVIGNDNPKGPALEIQSESSHLAEITREVEPQRVSDQAVFSEFYPKLKPIFSRGLGALCWKGSLELIDGSDANVVVVEDLTHRDAPYSIATAMHPLTRNCEGCEKLRFPSARQAIVALERQLNKELFLRKGEPQNEHHHG